MNLPVPGAKFRRKSRNPDHPLFEVTSVDAGRFSTTINLVCTEDATLGATVPLSRLYDLYDPAPVDVDSTMKIYTADFAGVYLTGYALVFARDKTHAHQMLAAALAGARLLDKQRGHLPELTLRGHAAAGTRADAVILCNGDY